MNDFVSRIEAIGEMCKVLPTIAKNHERILNLIQECLTAFKAKTSSVMREDSEGNFF
jgi:hypothetical protein